MEAVQGKRKETTALALRKIAGKTESLLEQDEARSHSGYASGSCGECLAEAFCWGQLLAQHLTLLGTVTQPRLWV